MTLVFMIQIIKEKDLFGSRLLRPKLQIVLTTSDAEIRNKFNNHTD